MNSSLFGRLLSIGSLQDPHTGHYADAQLSLADFDAPLDRQLRRQHRRLFAAWLVLTLRQQHDKLREYLGDCGQDPRMLIKKWAKTHWYDRLVPAGAMAPERELFISDFEILLAILALDYGDLQPENEKPGPDTISSSRRCWSPVVPIMDEAACRLLLAEAYDGQARGGLQ